MSSNNMFEEIDKAREELPDIKKVQKTVNSLQKNNYNFYQIIAIIIVGLGFIGGVILGNIVPSCNDKVLTNMVCIEDGFNIGLTFGVWVSTFLFALFVYAIGHIISLLETISRKLK